MKRNNPFLNYASFVWTILNLFQICNLDLNQIMLDLK